MENMSRASECVVEFMNKYKLAKSEVIDILEDTTETPERVKLINCFQKKKVTGAEIAEYIRKYKKLSTASGEELLNIINVTGGREVDTPLEIDEQFSKSYKELIKDLDFVSMPKSGDYPFEMWVISAMTSVLCDNWFEVYYNTILLISGLLESNISVIDKLSTFSYGDSSGVVTRRSFDENTDRFRNILYLSAITNAELLGVGVNVFELIVTIGNVDRKRKGNMEKKLRDCKKIQVNKKITYECDMLKWIEIYSLLDDNIIENIVREVLRRFNSTDVG